MAKPLRWKARYTVLSILVVTWVTAFMDRMVISVAMPYVATDLHLSPWESGLVMSAFFASYSIAQIPGGLLGDVFGVRKIATIAMLWWSVFTAVTGLVGNLVQMLVVRFVFGLGEGIYPACAFKATAVWFPKRERATANAIKLAAGPLGAALAPLVVVGIMSYWDWRHAFYVLLVPGVIISALFWIFVPDGPSQSSRVSPQELNEIEDGDCVPSENEGVGFRRIFADPDIIKYFSILFAFDIAYWGFTTWLPTYLVKARGFSMAQMGIATSLPFLAGVAGCIVGGWLSDGLFKNSRKTPIILTQLISAFLLYISYVSDSTMALVTSQTLAGFFLNVFFAAFWALPMNTVSKNVMGTASGFINMAGQIAAFISPLLIGFLVGNSGGKFDQTFALLIISILASCALVFTIPKRVGTGAPAPC